MKPSKLTPSGAPNGRGFLVQIPDGRRGRTYHSKSYIRDKIPVYLETAPDQYSEEGHLFTRDQLKIIGYID